MLLFARINTHVIQRGPIILQGERVSVADDVIALDANAHIRRALADGRLVNETPKPKPVRKPRARKPKVVK